MIVVLLPVVAALVAGVFAAQLARQWAVTRRGHALAWCLSLALFAVASAAVAVGVGLGWSAPVFGVYWVAGALLNVPMLAVGQLLLLDPRRALLYWTLAGLAAVWGVVFTGLAGFDAAALAGADADGAIPVGSAVLGGSVAYRLARPFSFTFLIVVAGSLYSAVRRRRWQLALIALGVSVLAVSSVAIRVGQGELFSVLLAVGVTIMYGGFLGAAGPGRRPARGWVGVSGRRAGR